MVDGPSIDGTRLGDDAYLAHLDEDLEALLAASDDLALEVPGCPGWTVRDLLSHVVGVYRHKVVALRTGAQPAEPDEPWGAITDDEDPREVLRSVYAELRTALTARPAGDRVWTWWPPEQSVGFWIRRMAHETAVHRWDAQTAAHGLEGADPVAPELAEDGIDELLGWLTWDFTDWPQEGADGRRVLVATELHTWTVTTDPARCAVTAGGDDAEALAAGSASGLLLWLWGRPGDHGVATGGDTEALRLVRERLDAAAS